MRAVILLALLGSALAVDIENARHSQRIVGGEDTTVQQYPYIANMQYGSWVFTQACGGSLLTQNAVLSAAHCFIDSRGNVDLPQTWRIRLGTSDRASGGVQHNVDRLILHERYNTPVLDNDVAIARISPNAALGSNIQTVSIAGNNFNVPDNSPMTAVGWGVTSNGRPSAQLQRVVIYTVNQQLCAERYAFLKTQPGFQRWPDVTDGMLCAGILGVGGKDACQGDSGGPGVFTSGGTVVQIGITSWGYGCGDAFYPGVLARVSHYTSWIVANA